MMKMVTIVPLQITHDDDDGQWDDDGDDDDCSIHYLNLFAYSLIDYYWANCCVRY